MDLRQLTPALAVSPQIQPDDVAGLAAAGFKVLVNNRPDDEVTPQIGHDVIARAAADAGMTYHYLPFYPGQVTPQLITDFAEATAGRGPVIAFCRSGHRCTVLWALSQAGRRPEAEIMQIAAHAGYDLSPVRPLIMSLASGKV